jgi:hypothetical protein
MHIVELVKYGPVPADSEQAFASRRDAEEFAYTMLCCAFSRAWIDGREFTKEDYRHE